MNVLGISNSVRVAKEPIACPQCGSTSRVGHGLCLNCLLQAGLGAETANNETLESVLAEIDVPDADWRIGNYQILEEIGRGGMGVIYRARQRHSRRIVALKRVLSYHADSRETLARFRREAEAAASLDHPNVLPIYEVSEGEDGLPFFSMKFAPGGSLLDAARTLRADPRRIVQLIAKVTRAVQHAHAQGIVHRELKPGNILLDGRGEPLVSDFGLAKWLDTTSDLTRTLTIFGTPGYIAPEQAESPAGNPAPAVDVYSLGAILFELLSGRPPFLGEHAIAVIRQAAELPAPKLRSIAPALDRDLETICVRCLERDPSRVLTVKKPPAHWTGAALQDEIEETARSTKSRAVFSGTCRRANGKIRISLHLVSENAVLGDWLIESEPGVATQAIQGFGTPIYKLLDQSTAAAFPGEDPAMLNDRARAFFTAGRDLMNRRTISEMDRAIACFEGAIREEPRSISARSFLAMACMGRDLLSAQPELAQRASEVGREAVRLAPRNPTAQRALCAVLVSYGSYREALEHGFQSIEFGDRSERAFGQIAYTWKALGRPDRAILWYKT